MRVIKSWRTMQREALQWRREAVRIGFVPTMGYLHDGHMSLVRRARKLVGSAGKVVVSIYVNPTQFGPTEDLARYPRDLARDNKLCRAEGVDLVFLPNDQEMYPGKSEGRFSTFVVEENLSQGMEGAARPTHFRGVTTVVAKLFNIVQADVAVFGQKDFQQAAVVRQMVSDLNFPTRIVVAPTTREADGLALSSRNKYLSPAERQQAVALWQTIQLARKTVSRTSVPAVNLKRTLAQFLATFPLANPDYVEIFDPATLQPVRVARRGDHLALAVRFGKTRLIDNGRL
ncbi:pantoate--beta-alanine ligase [bacterium]|nr:pantoate--beta-alanine ligase [bacterium]